jgi:hypothetical protein
MVNKANPQVQPKPERRRFNAEYKRRIVLESEACKHGELGSLLRRECLTYAQINQWRKAQLWDWKAAIIERLARLRLTAHANEAQVARTQDGIPWLGFVVYPTHRKLKKRNAVNFTRRLEHNIDLYEGGKISFAELDASVHGWINHVRYADTWGLHSHIFDSHPIKLRPEPEPPRPPKRVYRRRKKR